MKWRQNFLVESWKCLFLQYLFISGKKNSDWKQTARFQIVLLEEQMNVKQYS